MNNRSGLSWENRLFAHAKIKTQISFAVTAKLIKLIRAFVFATRIAQSLYLLNSKFQASRRLLWLYNLVYVRLGRKPEDRFSHDMPQLIRIIHHSAQTCYTMPSCDG